MKKYILPILVIALSFCLAVGCGNNTANDSPVTEPEQLAEATTRTITDMVGRKVEIPATVEKFVPLANTPRMITYLGMADKAVGIGGWLLIISPCYSLCLRQQRPVGKSAHCWCGCSRFD